MKTRLIFIVAVIAFVLVAQLPWQWMHHHNSAYAQTAPAVSIANLVRGLTLTFQNAAGETVDAREARLVALSVPVGSPASPLITPGTFGATWTGVLTAKIKDTYRFAAEGRGDLTVTLNDKRLLDLHGDLANQPSAPVLVKKGKNRIIVTYRSPKEGDASVRLLWAATGAPFEPVSPAVLMHDSQDDLLVKHQNVRIGRELVASLRCTDCHRGVTGTMPELKQDAPSLMDLKSRLNFTWAAYWISNPKSLRPTATMPRVFHDAPANTALAVEDRAGDIAAYLAISDTPVTPITDPQILAQGARLFTGLGCVACHVGPGVTDSDATLNRVPLKYVRAKFKPDALVNFLKAPEAHYAWIKMPNFHLSDNEASALSAWLISNSTPDALPAITKKFDATNGEKLFVTAGCMSCHAMEHPTTPPASKDFAQADFTRGCLVDDLSQIGRGVDFDLTADQRSSIREFIATDWKTSLQQDPLPEFASRQMAALRCTACHSMDGNDNTWFNLDTEITSIEQNLPPRPDNDPEPHGDQSRPPLTWIGEKLRPSWMTAFISGKIPYKPRQWLFARMPSFASRAELLSQGLAQMQGCPIIDDVRPPADDHLADIGKNLTSQTSFGCVKCHAVGDQAALAPFEAEAPNLAHVDARLRHEYFTHWMRNPQYFLPGTKMPSFANADGKTPYKDVLDGDAAAEYQAIWNYLRAGESISPAQ